MLVFVGHNVFRAYIKYRLNMWYEEFYDLVQTATALSVLDASASNSGAEINNLAGQADVQRLIWKFASIVAPMVVFHPIASWIRNRWVLHWRLALILVDESWWRQSEKS